MSIIHGHVGPATLPDGADGNPFRQGNEGQFIQSRLHGTHYESAKRGNIFILSTIPAGLAVPIQSTLAPTVLLWNPSGSGKNLVLIRYTIAYVSGTSIATPIGLVYTLGAGSAAATAAPIAVFTALTPVNGLLGGGIASVMKVSAAGTNTLTAAGTWIYTMFGESALIATSAMNPYELNHEFDGSIIIPPGVAVHPGGTAASGALLAQTFVWEEVPE